MKNSDHITYGENEDGAFADITLAKPINVAGTALNVLRMREPDVKTQRSASKLADDNADFEVNLFATLCGLAPDDINSMKMRDYSRLQKAYAGFIA